ncbi:glycerophosphodiester phosphodiesterase [Planctomycetota bacterium]
MPASRSFVFGLTLFAVAVAWETTALAAPTIVGHRGASADAPENTLEALEEAWKQGAGGAEIDVMLTQDKQLVLMHDDDLERVTGGENNQRIEDLDYAELKDIDVGSWKGKKFKDVRVPLLIDVLKALPKGKKLFIEVKSGDLNEGADTKNMLPALKQTLRASKVPTDAVCIISFDHDFINAAKKRMPKYDAYYLTIFTPCRGKWVEITNEKQLNEVMEKAVANKVDGLNIEFSGKLITKSFVETIHKKGLKVSVWGYAKDDTIKNAKKMAKAGVDYYMTNTPKKVTAGIK